MSGRQRTLPSWMAKKDEKVVKKEPLKGRRRRKSARAAFYCMNEKELVETAVSFLAEASCVDVALLADQKVEDRAADTTVRMEERPSTSKTMVMESSECSDAQDTYVSETDLDLTELETVPFTKSPQNQEPEGQGLGPVQDHGGLRKVGLKADRGGEGSQMAADAREEDDALQLVREIFFT